MRESCFSFLNRSIPFFPKEQVILKLRKQSFLKIEAPFADEISGLAIVRMLYKKSQSTLMLKLKFVQKLATLGVTNNSLETVIFKTKEMLGILDLKLRVYHKIKQGMLQQNLTKYYIFELADVLCENLINL